MRGGLVGPQAPATPAPLPEVPPAAIPAAGRRVPAPFSGIGPDAVVWVVLGVILTDIWRFHDLVPPTRALRPSIVLTLLGLVLLVATRRLLPTLHRLRSPIAIWYAVFLGLIVAGIPFSLDPAMSIDYTKSVVLTRAIIGLLIACSVRTVRDAEFLALGTLAGGFVYTVAHLGVPVDAQGRWVRLTYYDVNDLGLMLVVMLPIALHFVRRSNATPRRVFAALCLPLFTYALVRTGSRGGFVGFAIVVGYLLLRYAAVPPRTRVIGAVAAAIAIAIGGQPYLSRLASIFRPSEDYNWIAETGRLAIWQRGVQYIESRPLTGLGVAQFRTAEARLWTLARQHRMAGRLPPPAYGAHNMLMQVGAEIGLPALAVFVIVLGLAWRTLVRLRDTPAGQGSLGSLLAGAGAASLLGFCVCGLFLHSAFFPVLPLLLGLAVALADICAAPEHAPVRRRGGLFVHGEGQSRATA